ncbi:MAG: metallophosphoesterase, partial [Gemmatimonadetes bacterium]|nr:metallophosphoesterase [Gemmatimonadota bacterium]
MILAHLSDLHLGFRGHGRRERGRDAREKDVLEALGRAVEELVELKPDVVVVTGDVFDRPDPDPSVLLDFSRSLDALRGGLPDLPVALLAGPRDLPLRPGEPGILDVLGRWRGVVAATTEVRSLDLGGGELHLVLVPHGALVRDAARETPAEAVPDAEARFNVLAVHGGVGRGAGRGRGRRPAGGLRVDYEAWDYVALGGEHAHREAAANARYAGSLERVGWTPWTEALEEKGFFTVDLEGMRVVFHPLPVRPVVALAPIRVARGDPERLLRRVREVTAEVPGGIDDRIVRLRIQGASSEDLRALQDGMLGDLRGRALHLGLGVEEADEPAGPPDLAPRLATLLEAEGADPAGAGALLPEPRVRAPAPGSTAGRPVRVRGLAVRLPPRGLVALVGREPRERAALGRALATRRRPQALRTAGQHLQAAARQFERLGASGQATTAHLLLAMVSSWPLGHFDAAAEQLQQA